ncbi:MAG: shikimate dehydrogenase [Proteobacteria bacterium]|nr:shikimate dehydrogenase [Pseudomonadota bacterium]
MTEPGTVSPFDDIAGDPDEIVTGGFGAFGNYAVIGHPVAHSRSPELHMAWFRAANRPGAYTRVDISPAALVQRAPSLPFEFAGLNVTIPHKIAILGYVDRVDASAQEAGAANLLYRDEDKAWTAGNTDGEGYVRAFEDSFGESAFGKDVAILGAGGAARAVGSALVRHGCSSVVYINRSLERARELGPAALLAPDVFDELEVSIDLVVNTLPPAAEQTLAELDLRPLSERAIVTDINYYVGSPVLLDRARWRGLATQDGRGMFLWQAALSFEQWTREAPDMDVGRRVLGL